MILAFDAEADRWVTVFDASKTGLVQLFEKDTPAERVRIFPIHASGKRKPPDLVISANLGPMSPVHVVGIVRFRQQVAQLVYSFRGSGGGDAFPVGDNANRVRVRTQWHTAPDAHCCPVGNYTFEVAQTGDGYEVVKDRRPTLGVHVAWDDDSPFLAVVGVVPQGPADGILQPGDVILGVVGGQSNPADPEYRGTAVFHDVARSRNTEGHLLAIGRSGQQAPLFLDVEVVARHKLSSDSFPPQVPDLGLGLVQGDAGPIVDFVVEGGPAERAGIPVGATIEAIDGVPTPFPLAVTTFTIYRRDPFPIAYSSPTGELVEVVIEPATREPYRLRPPVGLL